MIVYLLGLVSVIVATSVEIQNADNYVTNEKYEERIAGGEEAEGVFREYQVQVVIKYDQFCSGAILNEYYILTAAHCVENIQPKDLYVRALTYKLNKGGIIISISEIVIHPEYDYPQNNNDVAYMRAERRIKFGSFFQPAKLDKPSATFPNLITVSGWGRQEYSQDLSDDLMVVNLTVIHNMRCQVIYPEIAITKNMFCAENTRIGSQGACMGDGGGPASRSTYYEMFTLVGISSFTRGCGAGMGPSVFTNLRAQEIRDFILNGTTIDIE